MELTEAIDLYLGRQDRSSHPDGTFDKQGRWAPSEVEWRACCNGVRPPSRAYPYSYMTHCRTAEHVAHLADNAAVTAAAIRKATRVARPAHRAGGDDYFKAVAVTDQGYRSIFDGETAYAIGVPVVQRARQGHNGGIYVYASPEQALAVTVPPDSALRDAPRAILRVRAEGAYCVYEHKYSFSRVTPLAIHMTATQVAEEMAATYGGRW